MKKLFYKHIDNHIMAYKSKTGYMPNAILIPEPLFEELERDLERNKLTYLTNCAGDGVVYRLDIIVTLDSNTIQPIRVINKEDINA